MASNTRETETRRARRHANMGKKRKAKESRRSTLTSQELFAVLGEPGSAKASAKASAKPSPKA